MEVYAEGSKLFETDLNEQDINGSSLVLSLPYGLVGEINTTFKILDKTNNSYVYNVSYMINYGNYVNMGEPTSSTTPENALLILIILIILLIFLRINKQKN